MIWGRYLGNLRCQKQGCQKGEDKAVFFNPFGEHDSVKEVTGEIELVKGGL